MPRILALDVQYADDFAWAAALGFETWTASIATTQSTARVADIAPYRAGHFFERELPCLLEALKPYVAPDKRPQVIVVDGYATLPDDESGQRLGLGAHLHRALASRDLRPIVVGVSKTHFHGDTLAAPVLRGQSERPLYVSAVGCGVAQAAAWVASMHGAHRMPTMLGEVDRLAREAVRDELG